MVMEVFWEKGEMTVRALCAQGTLCQRAYTTIMTTANRLYNKGLLCRKSEKGAYTYWPSLDRASYWQSVSQAVMAELMQLGGAPTLTAFVDAAAEQDKENLLRLEEMILKRKQERESS